MSALPRTKATPFLICYPRVYRLLAALLLVMVALQVVAESEETPGDAVLEQAQLDQILAPIALYPDALLAQILMASTYPLDVVEAARWSETHPELKGSEAVDAAVDTGWDPSVQALLAFPEILARMNENLRWTRQLGEAFLTGEQQLMDTVQTLRGKADSAGNLNDLEHVRVYRQDKVIIIESAQPQRIYVPYYNPMVIYGPWWRPAYPPVYWRPYPGYQLGSGFYWGGGVQLSSSYLFFSTFDWRQRHVVVLNPRIHVHRPHGSTVHYRAGYYSKGYYRDPGKYGFEKWQHRPEHRQKARQQRAINPGQNRYSAGNPQVDRGRYSPTGSYIRPPTRLDSTRTKQPSGRVESGTNPRVGTQPRSRTEQQDRSRSNNDASLRRSPNTDIQFRRGDPHRAPESRGGSGRSSQSPSSRAERTHSGPRTTASQRSPQYSPPQRSFQSSQQRSQSRQHSQPRQPSQSRASPGRESGQRQR